MSRIQKIVSQESFLFFAYLKFGFSAVDFSDIIECTTIYFHFFKSKLCFSEFYIFKNRMIFVRNMQDSEILLLQKTIILRWLVKELAIRTDSGKNFEQSNPTPLCCI